nr:metallophosphoesterase [uncultured Leptotrichia sp.]
MELNIKRIKESDYQKIFVLTDIHGRFDLFKKMIRKIKLKKKDLLLILGDSCDRGEFSFELYNWYKKMIQKGYNIIHLMGNHENMLFKSKNDETYRLNWVYNGGSKTIRSFFKHQNKVKTINEYWKNDKFYEEEWLFNFIEEMPHIAESENYLFVHAGIDFSKSLENQEIKYLLWTRDDWYKKNNTAKTVYYGHTPQEDITVENNCINLDAGCFFTNVLRCVELKEKKLYVLEKNKIKVEEFWDRRF